MLKIAISERWVTSYIFRTCSAVSSSITNDVMRKKERKMNSLEGQLWLYPVHTARCRGNTLEEPHVFCCRLTWLHHPFMTMLLLTCLLFFHLSVNQVKSACASWRERGGGNGAKWDDCKEGCVSSFCDIHSTQYTHTIIITRIDEQRTNMSRELGWHRAEGKGRLRSLTSLYCFLNLSFPLLPCDPLMTSGPGVTLHVCEIRYLTFIQSVINSNETAIEIYRFFYRSP